LLLGRFGSKETTSSLTGAVLPWSLGSTSSVKRPDCRLVDFVKTNVMSSSFPLLVSQVSLRVLAWLPLQSKMLAAFGRSMEFGCRFLPDDGTSKAAIPESLLAAFLLCVELLVFFCFVSLLAFLGQLLLFGILLDKFVQFFFFLF